MTEIEVEETTRTYKRPIESEYSLSGELLSAQPDYKFKGYKNVVTDDLVKGNHNPKELAALKYMGHMANYTAFVGITEGIDLTPTQKLLINEMNIDTNTGRGKGGWGGFLSKTSKSITENSLEEKSREINAGGKPGIMGRLFGR